MNMRHIKVSFEEFVQIGQPEKFVNLITFENSLCFAETSSLEKRNRKCINCSNPLGASHQRN